MSTSEQTIRQYLAEVSGPRTVTEISADTGYPPPTVYVALRGIPTHRIKRGKSQYGYILASDREMEYPSVTDTLGTIEGKTWRATATQTMKVVADAAISDHLTAKEYAEGFENLGNRFLELAAHARAVQHRPDWQIVLGFKTDTEQK